MPGCRERGVHRNLAVRRHRRRCPDWRPRRIRTRTSVFPGLDLNGVECHRRVLRRAICQPREMQADVLAHGDAHGWRRAALRKGVSDPEVVSPERPVLLPLPVSLPLMPERLLRLLAAFRCPLPVVRPRLPPVPLCSTQRRRTARPRDASECHRRSPSSTIVSGWPTFAVSVLLPSTFTTGGLFERISGLLIRRRARPFPTPSRRRPPCSPHAATRRPSRSPRW